MDWLDLLAVQGTLKSLLQQHSSKASLLQHLAFFAVQVTLKSLLQHHSSKASLLRCSAFFTVQVSHPYSSEVVQSCPIVCDTTALQASLSITNSQSPPKPMSIESVMPSSHLILCRPLFLLPPIPPSIRVFSNESTFHIRWPKYWSFSFSIIPSKEHPGLIPS